MRELRVGLRRSGRFAAGGMMLGDGYPLYACFFEVHEDLQPSMNFNNQDHASHVNKYCSMTTRSKDTVPPRLPYERR